MIPLSLRLSNFLSYRELDPPLSFESFRLACLSGRNGHGKSALFDAITWSLWGRARGVDERGTGADELIAEGQNLMQVEFVFELERNTYRVVRSRNKDKQTTRLEFQVKDNGSFVPLTGNSIRETQERINRALKLDYRTFVNSAFLLQGKADSFLTLKANERKEILAEILNLQIYDRLEEKARESKRELEKTCSTLQGEAALLAEELAEEEDLRRLLAGVENELNRSRKDLARKETELHRLKLERDRLTSQKKLLQEAGKRIEQIENEIGRFQAELEEIEADLMRVETYLKKKGEIEQGWKELKKIRLQEDELAKKAARFQEFQSELHRSETEIVSKMSRLEAEISNLKKRREELAKEEQEEKILKAKRKRLEKEAETLKDLEKTRESLREAYLDYQAELADLNARSNRQKEKIRSGQEKVTLLEKDVKPNCPLCFSELDDQERIRLTGNFRQEIETEQKELKRIELRLKEVRQKMGEIKEEGAKISRKVESMKDAPASLGKIDVKLQQFQAIRKKLAEVDARLKEYTATLNTDNFAPEAFQRKENIRRELAALGFQPDLVRTIRRQIKDKQHLEQEKVRLEQAGKEQARLAGARESLSCRLVEKKSLLETERQNIEAVKSEVRRTERSRLAEDVLKKTETEYLVIKKIADELQAEQAARQENLKRCQTARKRLEQLSSEQEQVQREISIYTDLALAFSKKGIQALIIENAVPEIEEEANKTLSRLTEDQMSLAFITQKNQKTGGVVETLDLAVSDGQGRTRKYELFSGGEAFRINFAVRIALSKLLTKRAGARLETLVIDEGFGTQDSEGKEKLLEAISAIQDDFKKIMVITHLDELKEMFPARIEVSKKPGIGSTAVIA